MLALFFLLLISIFANGFALHGIGAMDCLLFLLAIYLFFWKRVALDLTIASLFLAWFIGLSIALLFALADGWTNAPRSFATLRIPVVGFVGYCLTRFLAEKSRERAVSLLVLFGLLLSGAMIYVFLQVRNLPEFVKDPRAVKATMFVAGLGSNYAAAILLPIVPLAFWRLRGWLLPLTLVPLIGLLAIMSKGAILALLVATLLMLPWLLAKGRKLKFIAVAATLAMALLAATVYLPELTLVNAVTVSRLATNGDDARAFLWTIAWRRFEENPVAGVGPANTYIYNLRDGIDDIYSHNYVLNSLSDSGLVGTLPFLALIAVAFWRSITSENTPLNLALRMAVLATLIHGLVEPTFEGEEYVMVFWMLAGLMASGSTSRLGRYSLHRLRRLSIP